MFLRKFVVGLIISMMLMIPGAIWAGHPLITDDTGTQGKGKFQMELNGQYDGDKETEGGITVKSKGGEMGMTFAYGFIESADAVFGLPYSWGKVKEDGVVMSDVNGIGDVSLEVKWRFFEKDGFSLAVKPGLRLATGDEDKGLSAGNTGYQIFMIGSKEADLWGFHLNVGYIGNENKLEEEKHIWHASLAATYEMMENLQLVGNVGIESHTDKAADRDPAFILGGIVYSLSESIDIDFGLKYGLTKPETDLSLMAGVAYRF